MSRPQFKEVLSNTFDNVMFLLSKKEERDLKASLPSDLTINEVKILYAIVLSKSRPTPTLIAKRLNVTKGTLTTNIDKLVKKGYVMRMESSSDARVTYLILSESGKSAVEIYIDFHDSIIDAVDDKLDAYEKSLLLIALSKIEDVLYD